MVGCLIISTITKGQRPRCGSKIAGVAMAKTDSPHKSLANDLKKVPEGIICQPKERRRQVRTTPSLHISANKGYTRRQTA